jgi:hypothetical protein
MFPNLWEYNRDGMVRLASAVITVFVLLSMIQSSLLIFLLGIALGCEITNHGWFAFIKHIMSNKYANEDKDTLTPLLRGLFLVADTISSVSKHAVKQQKAADAKRTSGRNGSKKTLKKAASNDDLNSPVEESSSISKSLVVQQKPHPLRQAKSQSLVLMDGSSSEQDGVVTTRSMRHRRSGKSSI